MQNKQSVEDVYRALHQMPEPGFSEVKTSAYLAEHLRKAGYEVRTGRRRHRGYRVC